MEIKNASVCVSVVKDVAETAIYLTTALSKFPFPLNLQLHGPTIAENPELTEIAARVLQEHTAAWSNIQGLLNQCACLISYFKSAVI